MALANKKITECDELTTLALDDYIPTVDKSDTTDDPAGTSKWVSVENSRKLVTRTVTGTDSAVAGDEVVFLDPTSASFVFTLLVAVNRSRPLRLLNIADPASSVNTATVDGAGSETIGPNANVVLNPGERVTILPRTSSIWEIIG